jgi:hypothetical protein
MRCSTLLGITQSQLVHAAGRGLSTVVDFEKERRLVALARGAQAFVELLGEMDRFDLARLREGPLSDSAYDLSPRINR